MRLRLDNLGYLLSLVGFLFATGCNSQPYDSALTELQGDTAIIEGITPPESHPLNQSVLKLLVTYRSLDTTFDATCTATALSQNIILTAAHCLNEETVAAKVILNLGHSKTHSIKVNKFRAHKKYDIYSHDIAIALLNENLPKQVKTTTLVNEDTEKNYSKVLIAGYGLTQDDPVINGFRRLTKNSPENLHFGYMDVGALTTFNILLGRKSPAHSCFGDSGGPAFLETTDKTFIQVGISKSVTSPDCLDESNYEPILPHLGWIKENILLLKK